MQRCLPLCKCVCSLYLCFCGFFCNLCLKLRGVCYAFQRLENANENVCPLICLCALFICCLMLFAVCYWKCKARWIHSSKFSKPTLSDIGETSSAVHPNEWLKDEKQKESSTPKNSNKNAFTNFNSLSDCWMPDQVKSFKEEKRLF